MDQFLLNGNLLSTALSRDDLRMGRSESVARAEPQLKSHLTLAISQFGFQQNEIVITLCKEATVARLQREVRFIKHFVNIAEKLHDNAVLPSDIVVFSPKPIGTTIHARDNQAPMFVFSDGSAPVSIPLPSSAHQIAHPSWKLGDCFATSSAPLRRLATREKSRVGNLGGIAGGSGGEGVRGSSSVSRLMLHRDVSSLHLSYSGNNSVSPVAADVDVLYDVLVYCHVKTPASSSPSVLYPKKDRLCVVDRDCAVLMKG